MSHSRAAIAIAAACGSNAGGTAPASNSAALKDCPSPTSPRPAAFARANPITYVKPADQSVVASQPDRIRTLHALLRKRADGLAEVCGHYTEPELETVLRFLTHAAQAQQDLAAAFPR